MPRRRSLTGAQLETLLALPADEAGLTRHWTLGDDDLAVVERRRGDHNRLGFTLQLCAFRYPGRLLRPREAIPAVALRFVAAQIGTGAEALADYARRPQTRREQLDGLRLAFGFRMFTPAHRRDIAAWLLPVTLATTSAPAVASTLLDELRRRRIPAPGPSVIERLVGTAMLQAERHVAGQLTRTLTTEQAAALDALLAPKEGTPMSVLAWARRPPGAPGRVALASLVEQLERLARSASILPVRKASIRNACANSRARAAASRRSTCGRCRRSAAAPPWLRPCSTPSCA
jgi:Domain of unknown function (DUF4158)